MEVLEASKDRVMPECPVARQCGGCQLQMMSYEAQLHFKERKVYNNLAPDRRDGESAAAGAGR